MATFQLKSEVAILNCTENLLHNKHEMNKIENCRKLKKLVLEKTFSPNVVKMI